ncbi:hypothetical protein HD597_010565 [Nonomuraea thailandensis]|uniref:Uncharacterized protein n=1 Tax=Nonomuraea thailandensis TaxID=1188745 RepID=A0A9X2GTB8_9ACTN|nr:hypothetical protein [Nonomuraea thailandensis]
MNILGSPGEILSPQVIGNCVGAPLA